MSRWSFERRDQALFYELLLGVIRWHGRIEWLIHRLTPDRLKIDPRCYAAAAVGLYQLLFLDRVPDYAAVDTAVRVARGFGSEAAAGWVNAVLRRVAREGELLRTAAPTTTDTFYNLAILHSHPPWMVARWGGLIPAEQLGKFLAWNNRRPRIFIRIDRRRADPADVAADLNRKRVGAEASPLDPYFLELDHSGDLLKLDQIVKGVATVQDVSQGLVARLLDPQPGERILDLCAAPGGKTGHLAELCPDCMVTATDKSVERLATLAEMTDRRGLGNVEVVPYDEVLTNRNGFDAVLVDAPCTGTGVLARRPDLRWRRRPGDVPRMAALQLELLRYAAGRTASAGRIIYSTCSVEPEENGEVVERFLSEHREFHLAPAGQWLPDFPHLYSTPRLPEGDQKGGWLINYGPETRSDGVFAVRFERGR